MNNEKLIKNQKRNVIIIGVFYLVAIILSLIFPFAKLNYLMVAIIIALLVIMWITSERASVTSGIIGIIISVLFFLSLDILSIVLSIMLFIDSIKYVVKINKT